MYIESMPEVLTWTSGSEVLFQIHTRYMSLLADRLGDTLVALRQRLPALGAPLAAAIRDLPDDALRRLLTAPETSCRLLWPERESLEAVAAFLNAACEAELARLDAARHVPQPMWSALGDLCLLPDGQRRQGPVVEGLMPLDFNSPYSQAGNLASSESSDRLGEYTVKDVEIVAGCITSVIAAMRSIPNNAFSFVQSYIKVLMLRKSREQNAEFRTRSPERFIGLVLFENAHLPGVGAVEIAEGLVHETIHTLLGIDEAFGRLDPNHGKWLSDRELYDGEQRTRSFWTGNKLPLPTYIHACFVWYGLLQFWCQAIGNPHFSGERMRARITQAASGFLGPSLLTPLQPYREAVSPELLDTIDRMQTHVVEATYGVV